MNNHELMLKLCDDVAKESSCFSRHVGVVIAREGTVLGMGKNGPPDFMPDCLTKLGKCKRHSIPGYQSGKFLNNCPAVHAEVSAILCALMLGTPVLGATLYINDILPCKDCMGIIINSGIREIHCAKIGQYDNLSLVMLTKAKIKLYQNELEVAY